MCHHVHFVACWCRVLPIVKLAFRLSASSFFSSSIGLVFRSCQSFALLLSFLFLSLGRSRWSVFFVFFFFFATCPYSFSITPSYPHLTYLLVRRTDRRRILLRYQFSFRFALTNSGEWGGSLLKNLLRQRGLGIQNTSVATLCTGWPKEGRGEARIHFLAPTSIFSEGRRM